MPVDCDFLIAGAGAAGLYAANILIRNGFRVRVLERRAEPSTHSRSIGIHPPSLELLRELGLLESFLSEGVHVTTGRAMVMRGGAPCTGKPPKDGNKAAGKHRSVEDGDFNRERPDGGKTMRAGRSYRLELGSGVGTDLILTLPQHRTEALLEANLPEGLVLRRQTVIGFREQADGISVETRCADSGSSRVFNARYLLAADGMYSGLRGMIPVEWSGFTYPYPFCMGDFPDNTPFGAEAVIYLTPDGLVESFPLPGNLRRWVINLKPGARVRDDNDRNGRWHQLHATGPESGASADSMRVPDTTGTGREADTTGIGREAGTAKPGLEHPGKEPAIAALCGTIGHRTGYTLEPGLAQMYSEFRAHRYTATSLYHGRVVLIGDAAHVISPIGGQGMNFEWGMIRSLADLAVKTDTGALLREASLQTYQHLGRSAARKYGRRAHFNTTMGLPGRHHHLLGAAVKLLMSAPLRRAVARRFTMR